jgi:hypothetical protein
MIVELLDNPAVLDAVIAAFVLIIGYGARKVMALIDNKWANEHLAGVGAHAGHAVEAGLRAYRDGIAEAKNPDSDAGEEVTSDERGAARAAAVDRFIEEIGLSSLKRAMGITRGKSVTDADAEDFAEELIDGALDRARPLESA